MRDEEQKNEGPFDRLRASEGRRAKNEEGIEDVYLHGSLSIVSGLGQPVVGEVGEVFDVDIVEVVQVGAAAPVVGGFAAGVEPAGGQGSEVNEIS